MPYLQTVDLSRKLAKGKQSRLLGQLISYEENKVCEYRPKRANVKRLFCHIYYDIISCGVVKYNRVQPRLIFAV
jgi:hypothetical protein